MCCKGLECCRGAGSLILPCRMLECTGSSHWKEPSRDEPCSCSISWRILVEELILYVEISWSCWIACGNTVVLVEWIICGNTTVLEDRLKNLSLDLLSPLLWK